MSGERNKENHYANPTPLSLSPLQSKRIIKKEKNFVSLMEIRGLKAARQGNRQKPLAKFVRFNCMKIMKAPPNHQIN